MRITGDHSGLALKGRLDVRSAADARARLHRAVDGGQGDLVLDWPVWSPGTPPASA